MQDLAFTYPADLEQSEKHRLATRIFKGSGQQLAQSERCICCGRRIGTQNPGQGCWYNPISQLMFLGPGVPLLFVFIQNAMLFLGLLMTVFFFYALVSNILGGSCEASPRCIVNVFNQLSLPNKINDQLSLGIQLAVSAGFLLLYFIFSQYILFRIRNHNQECDDIITSPSDYSIIIQGLPPATTQRQIRQLIQTHALSLDEQLQVSTKRLKIVEVILSYSLDEYMKIKKEQEDQFMEAVSKDQHSSFLRYPIPKPIETGSFAIVVFDKQMSKQTFFNTDPNGPSICTSQEKFAIEEQVVKISRAPEPDDIIWENANLPRFRRICNIFFSYFFGIAILIGGGYLQYRLQIYQNEIEDQSTRDYFAYVSSVIVTVLNGIIVAFLRVITQLEGFQTITDLNRSLLIKICLFSFFNAGVFYSLANVLAQSLNSFNIQGNFSLEITLFMSLNAVTPNLSNFITRKLQFPSAIIRKLLKCGFFKRNQKQANEMFELSTIQFPLQYAYVIRTVWLTCFYAPFAPLVVPISIFGLIIFYFTEAELFRSSYRVPNMLSMDLVRMAMRLLDYTGLVFSIGQLLIVFFIKFTLKATFSPLQQACLAVCFGLSFAIVFFPSLRVSKLLFKFQERYENQTSYEQAINKFEVTYQGTNPLADPSKKQRDCDLHLLKSLDLFKLFQMKDFNLFGTTNNYNSNNSQTNYNPLLSPQQKLFSPFQQLSI